jgi:hypothetical protein
MTLLNHKAEKAGFDISAATEGESDSRVQDRTTIIACVVGNSITVLGFATKKSANA